NGINFAPFQRTPALRRAAREVRRRLAFGADDFVLLALANPRPQKRLERLPGILAATRAAFGRYGSRRQTRLIIAGEASCGSTAAVQAEAQLEAEIARLDVWEHVRRLGPVADVAPLFVAADALVSPSAYEGLSLAHLEAIAAGCPVVASDAGG